MENSAAPVNKLSRSDTASPSFRNLLLTLRFVGTRYHGFQVQKNAISVCEVFQDAVQKALGCRPDVKGCSRTDAGVHANMYCASMRLENSIPCERLVFALNSRLPGDIAVTACREVPAEFHARYSCTGKEYLYRLHNARVRDPFSAGLAYRWGYVIDADRLDAEAQAFAGRHDFAAFQAKGGDIADTVRTVERFCVRRDGETVLFRVKGDGFLYKMVRIMVGTLLHIAAGKLPPGCIPGIIESRERARAGKTAPACGLYLNNVYYDV